MKAFFTSFVHIAKPLFIILCSKSTVVCLPCIIVLSSPLLCTEGVVMELESGLVLLEVESSIAILRIEGCWRVTNPSNVSFFATGYPRNAPLHHIQIL